MDYKKNKILSQKFYLPEEEYGLFTQIETLLFPKEKIFINDELVLDVMELLTSADENQDLHKKLKTLTKGDGDPDYIFKLKQEGKILNPKTSLIEKERNLFWSEFVKANPFGCHNSTNSFVVYQETVDLLFDLFDKERKSYPVFMYKAMMVFVYLYKVKFTEAELGAFLEVLKTVFHKLNEKSAVKK